MLDRTITTSAGTVVSLAENGDDTVVLLDHPSAPSDMRPTEAGRVIDCAFQFTEFADWALSPEGLRAIADIIDGGTTAITEPAPAPAALRMVEGGLYRNPAGGQVRLVQMLRKPLAPGTWSAMVPGIFGDHYAEVTAEGLAACGYTLVTEAGSDGE